jgi:asparagine synthase (glutamine-hydrolysing)
LREPEHRLGAVPHGRLRLVGAGWRDLSSPPARRAAVVHGPAACDASALPEWLIRGCPTARIPVRQGFAVALETADGAVHAASSSRLELTLYYCVLGDTLLCAAHPRDLLVALPAPPPLSVGKLADLMVLHDDPSTTVFSGVRRLPTGHRLIFCPGDRQPRVDRWFRPEPARQRLRPNEAADRMRETIRDAVSHSLPTSGEPAAMLSGGLDSSMVVATAASLLGGERTIHTVTHVPLPGTGDPSSVWEADDGPYARRMAAALPGATWRPLVNEAGTSPLEAALRAFPQTWTPVLNPANMVWITQAIAFAEGISAPLLLTGATGNGPFSRGSAGVLRQMARERQVDPLLRQLAARVGTTASVRAALQAMARELAPPALLAARRRLMGKAASPRESWFVRQLPLRAEQLSDEGRAQLGRFTEPAQAIEAADWAAFLLRDASLALVGQALSDRVWWSDPLSDPEVTLLALSLPHEAWVPDGVDRGLARLAAQGLVPDDIRLRQSRGAQAADVGQWMAGKESAYQDALDRIRASAAAPQFLDVAALVRALDQGLPTGPEAMRWEATHGRALGLGLFACWYEDEVLAR